MGRERSNPEVDETVEPTPADTPEPGPLAVEDQADKQEGEKEDGRTDASGRPLFPWETTP